MMRQLLASALLLAAPVAGFAQIVPFEDVSANPYELQIELLHSHGIVQGYSDGSFRPQSAINRAEFLKILMLSAFGQEAYSVSDTGCFDDFNGAEQWFWSLACSAKVRGIIEGYLDGAFRGEQSVNFAEALKMTIEAFGLDAPQVSGADAAWYERYINVAVREGLVGAVSMDPAHFVTRGEMAAVIVAFADEISMVETEDFDFSFDELLEGTPVCGNGIRERNEDCDDGNTEDGDGCSSICINVPLPLRHAAIQIDQQSFAATDAAEGAEDIVLFAFTAVAGRQDTYLTGLELEAAVGSLAQAQNYRLRVINDGDGPVNEVIVTGGLSDTDETLSFSEFLYYMRDGYLYRFEVIADISTSVGAGSIGLAFNTANPAFVDALGVEDGRTLNGITIDDVRCSESTCWTTVYTQPVSEVTVLGRGNLYVTQDAIPVSSHQMRAGELSPVLMRLSMRAHGETIQVDTISIAGAALSVESLELSLNGSSTPFATARSSNCSVAVAGQLCAQNTGLAVESDEEVVVLVRARVKTSDPAGSSGNAFTLYLTSGTSPVPAVEATGLGSQEDLEQNNGDATAEGEVFIGRQSPGANVTITSSTHDVMISNITDILNVHGESDGGPVPVGTTTFAMFRFTASPKVSAVSGTHPVTLHDLVFTVNAENVEVSTSGFKLYNNVSPTVMHSCTASATTGVITVTCNDLETSALGTTISQGTSIDLGLEVNVLDPQVSGGSSTLQASLQDLGDRTNGGTIIWDDSQTTFQWVDLSAIRVRSTLYHSN